MIRFLAVIKVRIDMCVNNLYMFSAISIITCTFSFLTNIHILTDVLNTVETSFYGHCNELSSFPDCSAREEEKIYEDLCYVTFSSTLPQVSKERINLVISFCVFFIALLICSDTVSP